jgi:spore maturation protein CgeB
MKILYSFNKRGYESEYWSREIAAASNASVQFIPFNHDRYLDPHLYVRAQRLDELYFARDSRLLHLYRDFEAAAAGADAAIVDNYFPYHPDFLRPLPIYKVMRTSDGPIAAYDRDFAYVHAYDHVLYHSPAYSRELSMEEKLRYCGAKRADFWPLGIFENNYDRTVREQDLFSNDRDIDVLFVGAMHLNKMPFIAALKKALGSRLRLHGMTNLKRNVYFNLKYGFPGWVRPIRFDQYVPLYQRTKIGVNIHNRGDDSVGNYRLFELPANGVMQISDGGEHLDRFFRVGTEIERYRAFSELVEKIHWYLEHRNERERIARAGYQRVLADYKIGRLLQAAATMIERGMNSANRSARIDRQRTAP